jgi:hypothetical protein
MMVSFWTKKSRTGRPREVAENAAAGGDLLDPRPPHDPQEIDPFRGRL